MEAHSDESIVLQRLSEDLTHPKDDIQHVSFMRLPPEILCEIASHGLAMETGPKPWILNQVCTFVRETINSTKTLWSTICITRKGYYATKDDLVSNIRLHDSFLIHDRIKFHVAMPSICSWCLSAQLLYP